MSITLQVYVEYARDSFRDRRYWAAALYLKLALGEANRMRRRDYAGRIMRILNRVRPLAHKEA